MEANSEPGRIHLSGDAAALVETHGAPGEFLIIPRGEIQVKVGSQGAWLVGYKRQGLKLFVSLQGKGQMYTFWLEIPS